MNVTLNLKEFRNVLSEEQPDYLKSLTPGVFKAVEAAYYNGSSDQVDWDTFTLTEAEVALNHAMCYESDENVYDESEPVNEGNAVHEYFHSMNCIASLRQSPPEKLISDCSFF